MAVRLKGNGFSKYKVLFDAKVFASVKARYRFESSLLVKEVSFALSIYI
jgi:hypothetical protein